MRLKLVAEKTWKSKLVISTGIPRLTSSMRSVSFVEYLEFEFNGNILERAIALGDVDNDGACELTVANITGDLAIFKGSNAQPWQQYQGLGMVSCIAIDDVCNIGRNVIFSITSEGWCHLMCFGKNIHPSPQAPHDNGEDCHQHSDIISTYHQSFPTNGKVVMVADVDGDGRKELVIASTDRVVRVFKWVRDATHKESYDIKTLEQPPESPIKQGSKVLKRLLSKNSEEDGASGETGAENIEPQKNFSSNSDIFNGKFICVKRWKLAGQVETLSVIEGRSGTSPAILVSQPGAAYIYLFCTEDTIKENVQMQTRRVIQKSSTVSFTDCYSSIDNSRTQHPLSRRSETSSVPTYAISWCNSLSRRTNFIAMCTLNGMLSVVKDEKMYWSMNFHHNFFTVQKLDITGDGKEEIIFCSWDGETFVMDQYENIVNFKFGEDISAFCAGYYARSVEDSSSESKESKSEKSRTRSMPCLVYVTFNNRIRVYWNVKMSGLESRNFNDTVVTRLAELELGSRFRDYIEADDGSLDNERIKQLTSWCLYEAKVGIWKENDDNDYEEMKKHDLRRKEHGLS